MSEKIRTNIQLYVPNDDDLVVVTQLGGLPEFNHTHDEEVRRTLEDFACIDCITKVFKKVSRTSTKRVEVIETETGLVRRYTMQPMQFTQDDLRLSDDGYRLASYPETPLVRSAQSNSGPYWASPSHTTN